MEDEGYNTDAIPNTAYLAILLDDFPLIQKSIDVDWFYIQCLSTELQGNDDKSELANPSSEESDPVPCEWKHDFWIY